MCALASLLASCLYLLEAPPSRHVRLLLAWVLSVDLRKVLACAVCACFLLLVCAFSVDAQGAAPHAWNIQHNIRTHYLSHLSSARLVYTLAVCLYFLVRSCLLGVFLSCLFCRCFSSLACYLHCPHVFCIFSQPESRFVLVHRLAVKNEGMRHVFCLLLP